MNRPKKSKPKTARRANATPANPPAPPAGPRPAGDPIEATGAPPPPKKPRPVAPEPITPVGHSWRQSDPELTQLPRDLPPHYPNGLENRTWDAINAARELFPWQSQIVKFCRKVISTITPAFLVEVEAGRLRTDLAEPPMRELYELVVRLNCRDSERLDLEQEVQGSEEWRSFVGGLAKLEASTSRVSASETVEILASAPEPAVQATRTAKRKDRRKTRKRAVTNKTRREHKGDPRLLNEHRRVAFRTAEQYLGISERQRQNLIKRGSLIVEGQGQNRQITTDSLRKYLPPKNPK